MKVYRISKKEYAKDLMGTGAKLYGGRWNRVNTPCIYTSESRALALLEYTVNCPIKFIPPLLTISTFEIEDNRIGKISQHEIPENWKVIPASITTQKVGTEKLQKGIAIVQIPSIILPKENNFLLNPLANKIGFKLIHQDDFIYDKRIKR